MQTRLASPLRWSRAASPERVERVARHNQSPASLDGAKRGFCLSAARGAFASLRRRAVLLVDPTDRLQAPDHELRHGRDQVLDPIAIRPLNFRVERQERIASALAWSPVQSSI